MRQKLIPIAAMAVVWAGSAQAVTLEGYDIPYVGVGATYEFADSMRDSDNGMGLQAQFGWPLTQYGYKNWAAEATLHALSRKRDIDGKKDYQTGLLFDMVYDFGLFGWGDDASVGPRFKPFALAGLGVVQEDVRGSTHEHFGINFGGGALIPLNWHGLAARIEGRVLAQDNNRSVANEDVLIDYRINVGLQIPLTPLFKVADHQEAAPAEACKLAVVDPVTGRSDCGTDSDRDGVLDSLDQCPGTPTGTTVDARGCAVDQPATLVAAASADGCGASGAQLDADGHVVNQTLVMPAIQFENDTAVLQASATAALDKLVDTLRCQDNLRVEIGGHTDSIGNSAYNLMLSEQRAEAVKQYLIGHGVAASRLVAQGYGEFKPVASNDTPDGRAQNRRVEFKLIVN